MFFDKKLGVEIDRIKENQRIKDKQEFEKLINKTNVEHFETINEIHKKYTEKLKEIHEQHRKNIKEKDKELDKKVSEKLASRTNKFKQILKEKIEIISALKNENASLKEKLRGYEEAYENYKYMREHLISIIRKMKTASEKLRIGSEEVVQQFEQLEDMADFHSIKMRSLEPKIDKIMLSEKSDAITLKLIEKEAT